jgi:hypothetical protein
VSTEFQDYLRDLMFLAASAHEQFKFIETVDHLTLTKGERG